MISISIFALLAPSSASMVSPPLDFQAVVGPSIAPTLDEGIQISRKRAGFHVIKRTAE